MKINTLMFNPLLSRQVFLKSLRSDAPMVVDPIGGEIKSKKDRKTEAVVHDTRLSEEKKKDDPKISNKKKRKRVPADYIEFSIKD